MNDIGYEWLRQTFNLTAFEVSPPARIRPVARISLQDGILAVPAQAAPDKDNALEHILFALKHEGTHLQILSQALSRVTASELGAAVKANPNGRYLRVAASLWEAFTHQQLPDPPELSGAYVDVFPPDRYVTGASRRDPRWRVNFNGLGSLHYCATVRLTSEIERGMALDIPGYARKFMGSLSAPTLERALTWAYLHETENSFAIEREKPSENKAQAFARLLRLAHDGRPLSEDYLCELQSSAVSNPFDKAVSFRQEQNWLSNALHGAAGISYVPPPPALLHELMPEWLAFANAAPRQIDPIIAASVASFGFVFLHPFMDGNGRISRFVFHQALCASGKLASGHLLPVSAAMKRHEQDYLAVLQAYSKPARATVHVTWIDEGQYAFDFKENEAIYRYWDATACVEFGFRMAESALEVELKREAEFLQRYDDIVKKINEQADVRASDLSILVISCLESKGVLSRNKRRKYALSVPEATLDFIERTVQENFSANTP
jgi:Fic family protein